MLASALSCKRAVEGPRAPAPATTTTQHPSEPAEDEPAVPDGYCRPATVVSDGRGGAIFDACFDPQSNQTDLVGQRVDPDAMVVGSRVRVRRISGNVVSLTAIDVHDGIRVAWVAHTGDGAERSDERNDQGGGTREVAMQSVGADLAPVGAPTPVARYAVAVRDPAGRAGWAHPHVELARGPERSVVVLSTDGDEPCPRGGQRCATWSVYAVDADGASRRLRHESTASPSLEPQSLIRVGDDLAYLRGADAVRSTLFVHSVRLGGAPMSAMPAAMFDPLPDWQRGSLAWTGSAIVALGEERTLDAPEARAVIRVTATSGAPPTRPRATDGPESVRWPLVTSRTWRCVRRHPVLRFTWRGGAVELDPTTPGASIDLSRWLSPAVAGIPARAPGLAAPMAWTGRALLAIDGNDRLRRWTCARDGAAPTE
jgi:hypothetical protein